MPQSHRQAQLLLLSGFKRAIFCPGFQLSGEGFICTAALCRPLRGSAPSCLVWEDIW